MRSASTLLAIVVAIALLTGCEAEAGDPDGPVYVAIGDSYTAAPRTGEPSGFPACRQSENNYPHQLAEKAGLDLTDVSCSGAQTSALLEEQPLGIAPHDPQIEGLHADADIVTISMGANDYNILGAVLTVCGVLARKNPKGSPCADLNKAAKPGENADARLELIEQNMVEVVETVRERAPDAQIILVGYPQIFPDPANGGCAQLPLATGDLGYARDVNVGLNESMAAAAKTTGVEYVDLFTPTEGHDICADDPWIAGYHGISGRNAAPFHPYVEEQELAAKLLAKVID